MCWAGGESERGSVCGGASKLLRKREDEMKRSRRAKERKPDNERYKEKRFKCVRVDYFNLPTTVRGVNKRHFCNLSHYLRPLEL